MSRRGPGPAFWVTGCKGPYDRKAFSLRAVGPGSDAADVLDAVWI
jgi:hypothetical protein